MQKQYNNQAHQGPKQCYFTQNNITYIDYKDVTILSKFVNPNGRILSAKRTGTVAKMQRQLSMAIKMARFMALMPYVNR
jgi:small subunit ribosomal protein S18